MVNESKGMRPPIIKFKEQPAGSISSDSMASPCQTVVVKNSYAQMKYEPLRCSPSTRIINGFGL